MLKSLEQYKVSGSLSPWGGHSCSGSLPTPDFAGHICLNGVVWTGVGQLILKTADGYKFYEQENTLQHASGSAYFHYVSPYNDYLYLNTPIHYEINNTGGYVGTIIPHGYTEIN